MLELTYFEFFVYLIIPSALIGLIIAPFIERGSEEEDEE